MVITLSINEQLLPNIFLLFFIYSLSIIYQQYLEEARYLVLISLDFSYLPCSFLWSGESHLFYGINDPISNCRWIVGG